MAKNNRAARASRTEVDWFDLARKKEQRETYTSKNFLQQRSHQSISSDLW